MELPIDMWNVIGDMYPMLGYIMSRVSRYFRQMRFKPLIIEKYKYPLPFREYYENNPYYYIPVNFLINNKYSFFLEKQLLSLDWITPDNSLTFSCNGRSLKLPCFNEFKDLLSEKEVVEIFGSRKPPPYSTYKPTPNKMTTLTDYLASKLTNCMIFGDHKTIIEEDCFLVFKDELVHEERCQILGYKDLGYFGVILSNKCLNVITDKTPQSIPLSSL